MEKIIITIFIFLCIVVFVATAIVLRDTDKKIEEFNEIEEEHIRKVEVMEGSYADDDLD